MAEAPCRLMFFLWQPHRCAGVHMAHFQLGSFLIGFLSSWAQFDLQSFLMTCRIRNGKR